MKTCTKCGGNTISGPKFISMGSMEHLEYRCGCGSTWSEPTADSKHPADAVLNPFFDLAKRFFGKADELFDEMNKDKR